MTSKQKPLQKTSGKKFRSRVLRGFAAKGDGAAIHGQGRVDRKSRIIHGYSVATIGEALGHEIEFDGTTLDQIVALGNALPKGAKMRFTHPDMSNDGMGKYLGRAKNFRRVGDQVLADAHLANASHNSPQGDLGTYVMDLAEEDPEAFGTSVVVMVEREYRLNDDGTRQRDEDGEPLLPLARIHALFASDVVDDPAANPGGMFSRFSERRDPAAYVSATLDRLFGNLPADEVRERCTAYLDRYLHNRFPQTDEDQMTTETKTAETQQPEQKPNPSQADQFAAKERELKEREEKLAKAEADQQAAAERFAEEQRIRELCAQCGSKQTDAYLAAKLSLSEVKDKLLEERTKEHALSSIQGDAETDPPEQHAEYRREYQANRRMYERQGLSEDDYVSSRLADEDGGIVTLPAIDSP